MQCRLRVGAQVRSLRMQRGFTMEHLANKAKTSVSQIQRIERGSSNFGVDTIEMLAKALDVDEMDLFEDLGSRF